MKENTITVLKVAPMMPPEVVTLKNELRSLQEAVSIGADYVGLIEIVYLDRKTCILLNEEGKLIGLTPNRRYGSDILCGVFYVLGTDDENEFTSLSSEEIERYTNLFAKPDVIDPEEIGNSMLADIWVL